MAPDRASKTGMVRRLSPRLTGEQRRYLRTRAHDLDPIVLVGQRGISENLIDNFRAALLAHELVKVKVHGGDGLVETAERFHDETGAQLAEQIGHCLIFYKPHPDDPDIELPT